MNRTGVQQIRMLSVSLLVAGCGIAGENWTEKLTALETSVTQLIHNANAEEKYSALQTATKQMKVIASDWNWHPEWQMYIKVNPDRLFNTYLIIAKTAYNLKDVGYDSSTPPPPIKISPPMGPRRFAGMNPDDIDDPVDRETYKKAVDKNSIRYQKYEREHNLDGWISKYIGLCRGMLRAQSKTELTYTRLIKTIQTTVCEEQLKKEIFFDILPEHHLPDVPTGTKDHP